MAQLTASYNYGRFQKEAQKNEKRARKTERLFLVFGISVFLILLAGINYVRHYKRRQIDRRRKMEEDYKNREKHQQEAYRLELSRQEALFKQKDEELQRLGEIYNKVTVTIRQELDTAKSENKNIRDNYAKAQLTIEEINMYYEHDKAELEHEIMELTHNISELKKQVVFGTNNEKSSMLNNSDIINSLRSKADNPLKQITEEEFLSLELVFGRFFPLFLQDLKQAKGLNRTDEVVAMLSALGFRPAQIQSLTDKSPSQITNSKTKINKALFVDSSASTLYGNLVSRYGICS